MNREARRAADKAQRKDRKAQIIPILDITREHADEHMPGAQEGDLVTLQGFRRKNGGGVENCEIGEETPFKLHIIETTH